MFNQRKPAGFERKWSAHNLWFHYAVEAGLLGLLCILWVVYAAGREWARSGRLAPAGQDPFRPTITAASIGLLVDQCGDNTLLSVSTISGAWLLLALLVVPLAQAARPAEANTLPGGEDRVPAAPREEAVFVTGTRSREGSP